MSSPDSDHDPLCPESQPDPGDTVRHTPEDIALSAMMAVRFSELDACKKAAAGRNPWINHPPNTTRIVLLQDVLWAAESRLWKTIE